MSDPRRSPAPFPLYPAVLLAALALGATLHQHPRLLHPLLFVHQPIRSPAPSILQLRAAAHTWLSLDRGGKTAS